MPWTPKPIVVMLSFTPPLTSSWKLFTVLMKKFIQINVIGQCNVDIIPRGVNLNVDKTCELVEKNCHSSQIISNGSTHSYIWELVIGAEMESVIKAEFSMVYRLHNQDGDNKLFQYFFDIADYQVMLLSDILIDNASIIIYAKLIVLKTKKSTRTFQTKNILIWLTCILADIW